MQQLIKEIVKTLKPKTFLKLGGLTSYIDDEIGLESKTGLDKYDLILIDCKKDFLEFSKLYKEALKKLTSKGVVIVNGSYPKLSAQQNKNICGKVWFWLLDSGKEYKTCDDGEKGFSLVKNKDSKDLAYYSADFTWFYFNVKPNTEKELKDFVRVKRALRNGTKDEESRG